MSRHSLPNALGINTVSTVCHTVLTLWSGPPLNRVYTVATLCPALWLSLVLTTQITAGVHRDTRALITLNNLLERLTACRAEIEALE